MNGAIPLTVAVVELLSFYYAIWGLSPLGHWRVEQLTAMATDGQRLRGNLQARPKH